ncbi:MAG: SPOR domain-containing protein [Rhodanobacteraceae bacterium]
MTKRLLGAAVLIALAVIFVPMLLPSGSPAGSKTVGVKIPPAPDSALQTRVLQVGPNGASAGSSTAAAIDPDHVATLNLEDQKARQQSLVGSTPVPVPADTAPAGSAPVASTAPEASAHTPAGKVAEAVPEPSSKASAPEPSTPAKPAPPVAGGAGAAADTGYTVNLGIYADHGSANKLVAVAKQHGFAAKAAPESFQGKPVLRVRVGPFSSHAAAEAARLKLQGFEPVASMTVDADAGNQTADAPASALPAGKAGAWAVQLAAFSVEDQANMLRDRLRNQGFDGYVDSVKTAKGTLWRVRAGPFAKRDAADAARGQIAQKLKIKGIIVTE